MGLAKAPNNPATPISPALNIGINFPIFTIALPILEINVPMKPVAEPTVVPNSNAFTVA